MDQAPEQVLDRLVERARRLAEPGRRQLLGIVGPPGGGKSTLTAALVRRLDPWACEVPMDGFHLSNDQLDRLGRRHRKGAPDTFDAAGYIALLRRLRAADETVYAPAFDRDRDEPVAATLDVPPAVPLVISEGNYLLLGDDRWAEVRTLLDEVWYVETDETVRLERLVERHVTYGKSPEAARAWAHGSDQRNAELVAATRDRADLVVHLDTGSSGATATPHPPQEHAMSDPLALLTEAGVSLWLDDLSRDRLRSGSLRALVRESRVTGVTTNPSIFHRAVTGTDDYDEQLDRLARVGASVEEATRLITTDDVRRACDLLRPAYEASRGRDGRVSLEVDPGLAHDTEGTVAEAELLWWLVDRPNLMVKIPATDAGLRATTRCLASGLSINVTLVFGLDRYRAVLEAFVDGVERARADGVDVSRIESVASFFISRVDSETDRRLDALGTEATAGLRGRAGVANARLAYRLHEQTFATERWHRLAALGARPQRPLWASTGVKDPAYDDTRYVVELVAPGVVNTMPETTLRAVADHGRVHGDTVRGRDGEAERVMSGLAAVGVDHEDVVATLEREGLATFRSAWTALRDDLAAALSTRRGGAPARR